MGYSLWQGGNLIRWNLDTSELRDVKPAPPEGTKLRFNWNTGLATDPITPSALQQGVIWVGTDDGRLHVTRDGGKTWESVEKNVKGVPANTWIPEVRPSKHDPASAFVVFDNHRRGDMATYAYRTDDWGKTWKSLLSDKGNVRGYALNVEQDPGDK